MRLLLRVVCNRYQAGHRHSRRRVRPIWVRLAHPLPVSRLIRERIHRRLFVLPPVPVVHRDLPSPAVLQLDRLALRGLLQVLNRVAAPLLRAEPELALEPAAAQQGPEASRALLALVVIGIAAVRRSVRKVSRLVRLHAPAPVPVPLRLRRPMPPPAASSRRTKSRPCGMVARFTK